MSACFVTGCKNRYTNESKVKFYRLPAASRPFNEYRRRLWLEALQRVVPNIASRALNNARICGAHFVSGKVSLNCEDPDFVPSVFPGIEQRQRSKIKLNGSPPHKESSLSVEKDSELLGETPTAPSSPVKVEDKTVTGSSAEQSEAEMIPTSPSAEMEGETLTEVETVTEMEADELGHTYVVPAVTKIKKSPKSSKSSKALPTVKLPAGVQGPFKRKPVLTPPSLPPPGGYQCEECSESFFSLPGLIRHRQFHDKERPFPCGVCGKRFMTGSHYREHKRIHTGERPFPCGICERSFTTRHNLKRHLSIHTKEDMYRCRKCGALFCQRHDHNFMQKKSQDKNKDEPLNPRDNLESENIHQQELESVDDTERIPLTSPARTNTSHTDSPTFPSPGSSPRSTEPPAPHPDMSLQTHTPPSKTSPLLRLSPQTDITSSPQVFVPQSLTSAVLDVKRNYDCSLSKTKNKKKKKDKYSDKPRYGKKIKLQRIAYDIEVVL